jgi:hypothetical protein
MFRAIKRQISCFLIGRRPIRVTDEFIVICNDRILHVSDKSSTGRECHIGGLFLRDDSQVDGGAGTSVIHPRDDSNGGKSVILFGLMCMFPNLCDKRLR